MSEIKGEEGTKVSLTIYRQMLSVCKQHDKSYKFNEKYAKAILVKIKGEKSPYRVEPKCPHYNICGGCQFQHISYEGQLKYKKSLVVEAFDRYYDGQLNPALFKDTIGKRGRKMEIQKKLQNFLIEII